VEVELDREYVREIQESIPELPDQKLNRIIKQFEIQKNDAVILTKDKAVSDFFTACAPLCQDRKKLSHWIIKELFKLLNDTSSKIEECKITPEDFSHLINHITAGEITESIGRTVLEEMFGTGASPESIIEEKGLRPLSDTGLLENKINEVVDENPGVVDKISAGETKPIDFLIGQVMKKTKGRADAKIVKDLICRKLLP
jgi:aspartyl-tRNA(Asn)/glutamyl-tRNA(Gln) amidotransferase subunit B